MTPLPSLVVYMAIVTCASLLAASLIRAEGWTLPGMMLATGNRTTIPYPVRLLAVRIVLPETRRAAMSSFPDGRRSTPGIRRSRSNDHDAFLLLTLLRYSRLRLATSSGVTRPVLPPKCPIT
jgi:hypothetical protein